MKRVFIAGPYSADNVIEVLNNIRIGMRASTEVLIAGFAPFCPWHDFHYQLMLRNDESLDINQYYEYSKAWLYVSDAMLVLDEWQTSKGTLSEINYAQSLDIPIFYSLKDLIYGLTNKNT